MVTTPVAAPPPEPATVPVVEDDDAVTATVTAPTPSTVDEDPGAGFGPIFAPVEDAAGGPTTFTGLGDYDADGEALLVSFFFLCRILVVPVREKQASNWGAVQSMQALNLHASSQAKGACKLSGRSVLAQYFSNVVSEGASSSLSYACEMLRRWSSCTRTSDHSC